MLIQTLLVAHIALLGYWLGSELVINANFRYVSHAATLPVIERDRLLDHVFDVDQHVRYALILQLGSGTALAALLGYIPGSAGVAGAAAAVAALWLVLVEITHRQRKAPSGRALAQADNALRYFSVAALLLAAAFALTGGKELPSWLGWKFILFAGVILCGLGIRRALIRYYIPWGKLQQTGSTPALEAELRRCYWRATAVLLCLWGFIACIVVLSVLKP
jgi:predicted outer membrane lipoprotein